MIHYTVRDFSNNKIVAIKIVRMLTNCGLKDAKDLVEQYGSFVIDPIPGALEQAIVEARENGIVFDPPLPAGGHASPSPSAAIERGTCSVRYVSGPQVINAIKLVREQSGLGLGECKRVVDTGAVFKTELTRTDAERIAERFAEIGSTVEILGGPTLPAPSPSVRHDYQKPDDFDF